MSRTRTLDCDLCGRRLPVEHGKEVMFETGKNAYHVMDLCPECLDRQLGEAESINDTPGLRQKVAALIKLPGSKAPAPARQPS